MKKIVSIFLSLLILVSSTGFSFVRHYCPMSRKATYSFTSGDVRSCCGKLASNCCKNQRFEIKKLKDSFTPSDKAKIPSIDFSLFLFSISRPTFLSIAASDKPEIATNDHAPPGDPVSRVILFRSFLI